MSFEIFLEDPESDWNEGIMLEEYNGVFSLVSAQRSKKAEGTVYKKWAYPVGKDKKPIDKMFPMGVRMGSKMQAVKTLKYFLDQLTNDPETNTPEGENIPF